MGFLIKKIKSIRYTVNKYDGAVDIDTQDNWFNLKILIPLRISNVLELHYPSSAFLGRFKCLIENLERNLVFGENFIFHILLTWSMSRNVT